MNFARIRGDRGERRIYAQDMKRTVLVVAVLGGCSADDVQVEPDALQVDAGATTDAAPGIDGPITTCTPAGSTAPPVASAPPSAGSYCARWRQLDGIGDAPPRYYDRAEVELTGVQWTSEAGKGYDSSAGGAAGCLDVAGFDFGFSRSDTIRLCWTSTSEAHGLMNWRATDAEVTAHWTLCLFACQP
jgi:hypothetical protein